MRFILIDRLIDLCFTPTLAVFCYIVAILESARIP